MSVTVVDGSNPGSRVRPTTDATLVAQVVCNPDGSSISGAGSASSSGIAIPYSDYVSYAYYGSTNNIQTATYKTGGSGGTTVATLTFTYVGGGAANDDNVASITKT